MKIWCSRHSRQTAELRTILMEEKRAHQLSTTLLDRVIFWSPPGPHSFEIENSRELFVEFSALLLHRKCQPCWKFRPWRSAFLAVLARVQASQWLPLWRISTDSWTWRGGTSGTRCGGCERSVKIKLKFEKLTNLF